MSWKYLDDFLLRLGKNSTLIGKFWVASMLLFRLVVLVVFGENVWSDEQREFTCNTKQPGCGNVCFSRFAPISNIRLWGFQMLIVSIPGSFYFVYVLHLVSRIKETDAEKGEPTKKVHGKTRELSSAHTRWKKLTSHVIPPELHESRAKCVWRLYIIQLIARILLECLFVAWQYTTYHYTFTVPAVMQCTEWPCPHIVDCFISRPREKTLFLRYMYAVSAFSVALSVAEVVYITWACVRRTCVVEHDQSTARGHRTASPLRESRDAWLESDMKRHHPAVMTSDSGSMADSDVTSPPITPDDDYDDMQPVGRMSYL